MGPRRGDSTELARAHHGSIAREQRLEIEDALKAGRLRALVATSSLELGIDMGAVDLVVQVEAPPSVATGLQRIGRAGHRVGEPSKGKIFPKFRGDLVVAAVTAQRMQLGLIEETRVPRNPLDVLAQQVWPWRPSSSCASTRCSRWRGAPTPSPTSPGRPWRPCSTCCRVATRPTSSPSCAPASSGTASRGRCGPARVPACWPSPAAAPSPTAACSASSRPRAAGSGSWTRRWSTRAGWARPSSSAPPRGASWRSPATGWW